MMTFNTFVGKTYVVTTANGCTVTTEDGLKLAEIEAGKQGGFVAIDGKVVLSDDSARLTQVFKLAPQQRLALLGVLGGNGGLPAGYKRVEWLQSDGGQYINTLVEVMPRMRFEVDFIPFPTNDSTKTVYYAFGGMGNRLAYAFGYYVPGKHVNWYGWLCRGEKNYGWKHPFISYEDCISERQYVCVEADSATIDGIEVEIEGNVSSNASYTNPSYVGLFAHLLNNEPPRIGNYRIFGFKIYGDDGYKKLDFIPCVNTATGEPCMYDTVSRTAFYNQGSGDFTYPTQSTTFSLRRVLPDWGKLTEHGLRRLYHAPANYQGELYDYALENGYKPLVEPEKPETGYWSPRWTETEEEIVLEWVETEPPTDEFGMPAEPLTNN